MLRAGIKERLEALVEAGATETVEGRPFVSLVELESGARCGLFLHDDGAGWAVARGDVLAPFSDGKGGRAFVEVLEQPRDEFDQALDAAGARHGFEGDPISFSFPAVELVRLVLASRAAFLRRRALTWLLPTELRELRSEIAAVAEDTSLPVELRDLASRLVVTE